MITKYNIDHRVKVSASTTTLLDVPMVVRVNKFNEDAAKHFADDMAKAHTTGQEIIPVVCDSYGGTVYSLLAMIDVIRSATVPVATIIEGKAMSCGAVLATCGSPGLRFMGGKATMMIHDVSSFSHGKISDIKENVREGERLNKIIFNILDENARKDSGYFWDIVQKRSRVDWYVTPNQAKKHKLIDVVGIPTLQVDIKMTQELVY